VLSSGRCYIVGLCVALDVVKSERDCKADYASNLKSIKIVTIYSDVGSLKNGEHYWCLTLILKVGT
jgi:hypothetical protein